MKKFLVVIGLLFVWMSCQDVQYPDPPENLLPKEKMIEIIADAYIGNAARSKSVNNRVLRAKGVHLDSILYTKHQVDSLTFAQSNTYYAANLEAYTEIITEVERLLMDSLSEGRKRKKDSLKSEKSNVSKTLDSAQLGSPMKEE